MRRRALRGDSGQTAVDYVGILVLVVLIVLALLQGGLGGRVVQVVGGAAGSPATSAPSGPGRGAPGGSGSGGAANPGGSGSGGATSPGGSGSGGATSPGGSGSGGAGQGDQAGGSDWIPCNTSPELPGCALQAAVAPNGFREGVKDRARQRYRKAMRTMRNSSARPGSPEFERLRTEVQNAKSDLVRSRAITENPLLKAVSGSRKFFDPRFKDVAPAARNLFKGFGNAPLKGVAAKPVTGMEPAARPAGRFVSGLGKFGKGLGAVGVAFGAYSNVKADGAGKGLTKTAAGAVGGWAAATGVGMACAAVGVATAGVGAVACGVGALAASVGAGMVASKAAGWAWDRGSDAVNWTGHQISRGVRSVASKAAGPLAAAGKGLTKLGSALRPGFL